MEYNLNPKIMIKALTFIELLFIKLLTLGDYFDQGCCN